MGAWRDRRDGERWEEDARGVLVEREDGPKLDKDGGSGSQSKRGESSYCWDARMRMPAGMMYRGRSETNRTSHKGML